MANIHYKEQKMTTFVPLKMSIKIFNKRNHKMMYLLNMDSNNIDLSFQSSLILRKIKM